MGALTTVGGDLQGCEGFLCCFVKKREIWGAVRGAQPLLDTGESPQHGSCRTHLEETRLHRFHGSRNGVFHFAPGRERGREGGKTLCGARREAQLSVSQPRQRNKRFWKRNTQKKKKKHFPKKKNGEAVPSPLRERGAVSGLF